MRKTLLLAGACALALSCSKDTKTANPAPEQATSAKPAAKPAPPTIGPARSVTVAELEQARALVDRNMTTPWDKAWAGVAGALGKPHRVDGAKRYWYAVDGERCYELRLEALDSAVQPTFAGLSNFSEGIRQYRVCVAEVEKLNPK